MLAFQHSSLKINPPSKVSALSLKQNSNDDLSSISRRNLLQVPPLLAIFGSVGLNSAEAATKATGATDGNLPDLPMVSKSYLQYRFTLQVAADYYVFELMDKIGSIDDWGEINQLFQTMNNRGQGQPNKIERDFINPMRILSLSMPPDEVDSFRDTQFKFERACAKISKAVAGIRRDLPVEVDKSNINDAAKGWEEGRVALNEFFTLLNSVTGLNELTLIPPIGSDQIKRYGRSPRKYFELTKKTKLCQNRGGPALAQAWGQLMVSGYLQDNMDSCGIPDPVDYFYQ